MTLFHATERLGKVQSVSREGFLICEGVPVSRTGDLLYAPGELPIPPGPDGLIHEPQIIRVKGSEGNPSLI